MTIILRLFLSFLFILSNSFVEQKVHARWMCMTLNPLHAAEIPFENRPYLHASPAGKAAALICFNVVFVEITMMVHLAQLIQCLPILSMYLQTKLLEHQPEKSNGELDKKHSLGLHSGTQNIYQF